MIYEQSWAGARPQAFVQLGRPTTWVAELNLTVGVADQPSYWMLAQTIPDMHGR